MPARWATRPPTSAPGPGVGRDQSSARRSATASPATSHRSSSACVARSIGLAAHARSPCRIAPRRARYVIGSTASNGPPAPGTPSPGAGMGECEPRNFLRPCLLLLLQERPAHGYDLVERLHTSFIDDTDAGGVY